ncbi:hypothetical protein [Xanthomarina sp. GH4-25]|uniref:hypothetical protein n=1 Tax=Xanthomarina sp. GH4-25 TaxID=3349335 RepID=UPI003877CD26
MTKNTINFIATIIIAGILSQILPWWSIMVAAFATSLFISLKRVAVFVVPFLATTLFWMVYALWLSNTNDFVLAKKIAVLLPLGGNAYLLTLVTGIIGGIAAGISGIFGKQCVTLLSDR